MAESLLPGPGLLRRSECSKTSLQFEFASMSSMCACCFVCSLIDLIDRIHHFVFLCHAFEKKKKN